MNKQQPLLQINNLRLAYGAKEILKAVQLTAVSYTHLTLPTT